MKKRYEILNTKICEDREFRIIYDPDAAGHWNYKIQFKTNFNEKFKKIWSYQSYQSALNDFVCKDMVEAVLRSVV